MLVSTTASKRAAVVAPAPATVPWLWIERATNGYLIRDSAAAETWLIANEDWLAAAAALLAEINGRLGSAGDTYEERQVFVSVEPGDHWLRSNPDKCRHERVHNTSHGESGLWVCICGVEFVPIARPVEMKAAA